MKKEKIPQPTIERLPIYYRCILQMKAEGIRTVSSEELGRRIGVNSAQIRKDLTYFGEFGRRGIGYEIESLIEDIMRILGVTQERRMLIVGVGNLGTALLRHRGFSKEQFHIVAAFDSDPEKIGQEIEEISVYDLRLLDTIIKEKDIEVAVVTVPAKDAQRVVNQLVGCDIKGILNFAPTQVTVPENIKLRNVDLGVELLRLSYHLTNS